MSGDFAKSGSLFQDFPINAAAWVIERKPQIIDGMVMVDWRKHENENCMPCCSDYFLLENPDDSAWKIRQSLHGEPSVDEARRAQGRVQSVARDPVRFQVEQRVDAPSAAGYPLGLPDESLLRYF